MAWPDRQLALPSQLPLLFRFQRGEGGRLLRASGSRCRLTLSSWLRSLQRRGGLFG
jgi:hypothetical protein